MNVPPILRFHEAHFPGVAVAEVVADQDVVEEQRADVALVVDLQPGMYHKTRPTKGHSLHVLIILQKSPRSGLLLTEELLQRNPEFDVDLVSGADVHAFDQSADDQVLGADVGFFIALSPGGQLINSCFDLPGMRSSSSRK